MFHKIPKELLAPFLDQVECDALEIIPQHIENISHNNNSYLSPSWILSLRIPSLLDLGNSSSSFPFLERIHVSFLKSEDLVGIEIKCPKLKHLITDSLIYGCEDVVAVLSNVPSTVEHLEIPHLQHYKWGIMRKPFHLNRSNFQRNLKSVNVKGCLMCSESVIQVFDGSKASVTVNSWNLKNIDSFESLDLSFTLIWSKSLDVVGMDFHRIRKLRIEGPVFAGFAKNLAELVTDQKHFGMLKELIVIFTRTLGDPETSFIQGLQVNRSIEKFGIGKTEESYKTGAKEKLLKLKYFV
jgi:hypothetical protein